MLPVICTRPSRLTMEGQAGWVHQISSSLCTWQRTRFAFLATTMLILAVLAPCPSSALADSEAAHIDGDDIACLREFKESVTDSLGFLKNWDFRGGNAVHICNFVGVTCLHDQPKVYKLDLAAAGLRGRFPRGLHKCSSLTELNLSNNFFTGRIPPTICSNNPKLVALDLSDNSFSQPIHSHIQKCLDSNIKQQLHLQNSRHLDHELGDKRKEAGSIEMFSDLGEIIKTTLS